MKKNLLLFILVLFVHQVFSQTYPSKFSNIHDWHIDGEKQYFSPDNLYDYINGASDFYLGYDFKDLWVVDYKNASGQLLTLELYRHGNPLKTFGIYSEERPLKAKIDLIGAQGFVEEGAVFFLAHDYYVKVYNGQPKVSRSEMISFSKEVAELICKHCTLPEQFNSFPPKNKVNSSERYMAENFMGLTGLNGVCTVEYKSEGEDIRLFVYEENDERCRELLAKYFKRVDYKKRLKAKQYNFTDPYIGQVVLIYNKGMICGLLDSKDPKKHQALLDQFYADLLKK